LTNNNEAIKNLQGIKERLTKKKKETKSRKLQRSEKLPSGGEALEVANEQTKRNLLRESKLKQKLREKDSKPAGRDIKVEEILFFVKKKRFLYL